MEETVEKAVARIKRMEACFDLLRNALDCDRSVCGADWFCEKRQILCRYYESGLWLSDYEMDEKGLLPPELKHGVLSQDAVYDFLEQSKQAL